MPYILVIIKHLLKRSQPESDSKPAAHDLSILDGRINEFVHENDQNAAIRQNVNQFEVQAAVPFPGFGRPSPKIEFQQERQRVTKFEEADEDFSPIREVNLFNNPAIVNNFDNDLSDLAADPHRTVNTPAVSQERPRNIQQFPTQSFNQNDFTFSSLPSRFSAQRAVDQEYFFGPPGQTINMRDGSYTIITLLD